MILLADSEGPDQTARMRRLIWAFAVRICPETRFRMARPIYSIRLMADISANGPTCVLIISRGTSVKVQPNQMVSWVTCTCSCPLSSNIPTHFPFAAGKRELSGMIFL